jgi:putative Holliday junction resolvase
MKRLLGVDYGRRRIGLAVSDEAQDFAFAHDVLDVRGLEEAVERVAAAARAAEAERVVVGMPVNMNGTRGPMAEEVARFAAALRRHGGLPVECWDERLTTRRAEQVLLEADVSRRKRRAVVDKLAAQQLLQSYLDSRPGREEREGG